MKKLLLSAFALAVAFAASAFNMAPIESNVQLGARLNAKQAPKEVVAKLVQKTIANRAPQKINTPVTVASDLQGGYSWTYQQASERTEDPANATVTGTYTQDVIIYDANDVAGTFKIAGMFDAPLTGTLDLTSYSVPTFTIADDEAVAYTSNYGACTIHGVFYYEGDDDNEAGWYYTDNVAFIIDGEILWASNVWIVRVITEGQYVGYSLNPIYMPSSEMVEKAGVNGIMNSTYNNLPTTTPVSITENEQYVVTIDNFAGLAVNPVLITLAEGRVWSAPATVLFTNTNGSYALYGTDGNSLFNLTGTGTETTLTFDTDWTGYDTSTNYWIGQRGAATITLLDGEFVYPGEAVEPALYLSGSFNEWTTEDPLPFNIDATGKFTVTQEMEANAEFKLLNEKGEWFGGVTDGNNFIVTEEQVTEGTELELSSPGMNFQIPVAGTWTFTVDPETMKLVISGQWVEVVEPTTMYVLGEVNENGWAPNVGVEMATEDNNVYTATVNFDGRNEGYNYFSFSKVLAENADDWAAIAAYRIGAVSEGDFEVTEEYLNTELSLEAGEDAFKIPAGEYTLTLTKDVMKLVIAKVEPTLPVGDITGDGKVDVADVNAAINIILKQKTAEDYPGSADLNDDNKVDVADVNAIINIILKTN